MRATRGVPLVAVVLAAGAFGCGPQSAPGPSPGPTTTSSGVTPEAVTPGTVTPQTVTPETVTPDTTSPRSSPASSPAPRHPSPTAPSSQPAPCRRLVDRLSLGEQVGQLLMVAVSSAGLSPLDRDVLADTRAGSVLLLGNTTAGVDAVRQVTEGVRRAAKQPARVGTLLAADQEGGQVQRLSGPGFARIPSAREQAELSDAELARRARRWGRELRQAGVDADLAPVADVVPEDLRDVNAPIGRLRRGYGPGHAMVAAKVTAFVRGMANADVATAAKHFPGLGRVRGNTDVTTRVVDARTTRHDPSLAAFAAAASAGADMIMVSSAFYAEIDPDHRAAFSPTVIKTMIRRELRFDRVVISDDLAAAAMQDVSPRHRILRFLTAGGDLAIAGDPRLAGQLSEALREAARDDPAVASAVAASATRVVELKARRGLAHC